MGHAIAERLLAKRFALTVWNRTAGKAGALTRRGAKLASTPRAAAASADIVALCLRDAEAVEEVLFGADGAAESLRATSVVLDFSTLGIEPTRVLADRVAAKTKAPWVDAPVSGGPGGARAGSLAIFCGGTKKTVRRVAPVLKALSRQSTHMGAVGAGQATKLCNQLIASTAMLAVSEAISAAKAFGLNTRLIPKALAGGYADSLPLQIFGPRMASQRLTPRISEIGTMHKDVKAVLQALAQANAQLRLIDAAGSIYERAMEQGLGPEDLGALVRLK